MSKSSSPHMKQKYENNGIFPSNWWAGFANNPRLKIACGGTEVPVLDPVHGWTLLLWDTVKQKHFIYKYSADMVYNPDHLKRD